MTSLGAPAEVEEEDRTWGVGGTEDVATGTALSERAATVAQCQPAGWSSCRCCSAPGGRRVSLASACEEAARTAPETPQVFCVLGAGGATGRRAQKHAGHRQWRALRQGVAGALRCFPCCRACGGAHRGGRGDAPRARTAGAACTLAARRRGAQLSRAPSCAAGAQMGVLALTHTTRPVHQRTAATAARAGRGARRPTRRSSWTSCPSTFTCPRRPWRRSWAFVSPRSKNCAGT